MSDYRYATIDREGIKLKGIKLGGSALSSYLKAVNHCLPFVKYRLKCWYPIKK